MSSYDLEILLIEGKDLIAADRSGTSDPYCLLKTGMQHMKSKKIPKTLQPIWNEKFTMQIKNGTKDQLHIEVLDWDRLSKDDMLGNCVIPLTELTKEGNEVEKWVDLQSPGKGIPASGKIHIKLKLVKRVAYISSDDE